MDPETLTLGTEVAGDVGGGDTDLSGLDAVETPDIATETPETPIEQTPEETPETQPVEREEPELSEFKGMVSAKLRGIVKEAPELAQVFQKYPKVQERIEATFRREAALREIYPTVAEARFMRDQFPNGQADVTALLEDVGELAGLDKAFDTKDREGNYPGHSEVINNFFQRDRSAAVSMMRTVPKEWARLDRESYDDTMGKIVGATLSSREIPQDLQEMFSLAEGNAPLQALIRKTYGKIDGYIAGKPAPTQEEQRLQRDRQDFDRQRTESSRADGQRFHAEFVNTSKSLQSTIISQHPAIKRLEKVSSISPEKRKDIVEKIRVDMEKLLGKSPSFMRKLRPLYEQRNTGEMEKLQRAAWSQPWLLNKMVRQILSKEVPQMVSANRDAAARRTGTPQRQATPANPAKKPTGPQQVNGRWYKDSGQPFSTAELLAGKHLAQ